MADSVPSASTSEAPIKLAKSARGRELDDADTRISKTLSYILRHGAAKEALVLRPDGFVRVSELLARPKLKGVDLATLERIVGADAKSRYTIQEEDGEKWIRANQGHSVKVDDLDLTPILSEAEVPVVVHGTHAKLWAQIKGQGLKVMKRNHVHCAVGLPGDAEVISGMRQQCTLFVFLDVPALLSDGIPLFRSSNGVILTPGDASGAVAPKYFKKVVKKNGEVLWQDGAAVTKTAEEKQRSKDEHTKKDKQVEAIAQGVEKVALKEEK